MSPALLAYLGHLGRLYCKVRSQDIGTGTGEPEVSRRHRQAIAPGVCEVSLAGGGCAGGRERKAGGGFVMEIQVMLCD